MNQLIADITSIISIPIPEFVVANQQLKDFVSRYLHSGGEFHTPPSTRVSKHDGTATKASAYYFHQCVYSDCTLYSGFLERHFARDFTRHFLVDVVRHCESSTRRFNYPLYVEDGRLHCYQIRKGQWEDRSEVRINTHRWFVAIAFGLLASEVLLDRDPNVLENYRSYCSLTQQDDDERVRMDLSQMLGGITFNLDVKRPMAATKSQTTFEGRERLAISSLSNLQDLLGH